MLTGKTQIAVAKRMVRLWKQAVQLADAHEAGELPQVLLLLASERIPFSSSAALFFSFACTVQWPRIYAITCVLSFFSFLIHLPVFHCIALHLMFLFIYLLPLSSKYFCNPIAHK